MPFRKSLTQRGKPATKGRFFASLRMTCHPERSEESAVLSEPRNHKAIFARAVCLRALRAVSFDDGLLTP